jgi:hypothetical protein
MPRASQIAWLRPSRFDRVLNPIVRHEIGRLDQGVGYISDQRPFPAMRTSRYRKSERCRWTALQRLIITSASCRALKLTVTDVFSFSVAVVYR